MQYYVNISAAPGGNGSQEAPFCRIQQAADVALPGDEVIVAPGIYRENVNPRHSGTEEARIVYRSAQPLKAVIKGSEPVNSWEHVEGDVWTARVSNSLFTERHPYTTLVRGDWLSPGPDCHTGDVFLNGKSMYEVSEEEGVFHPQVNDGSWEPDFSLYTWHCAQDGDDTVFLANFHGLNPNEETVEITARSACFYPHQEGIGYVTLSGFTVTQAATQWAPPTAYQEGMIGPHWSKGWIIEDCEISESKCSGISLGKYLQPENDNKWLKAKYKDGTQTERDCICQAQREGWTKERIGSHIVRRCHIHHCGQTGIVGHLGGVFSLIEDNHIHNINNKQDYSGAEIGGIKMHAAIDVVYRRNHIHHCTRGLWLDWQAQGTRVTQNFFHHNALPNLTDDMEPNPKNTMGIGEDLFIEVSHGPTLVDNNFFLSPRSVKLPTQGVALVHNLIAGGFVSVGIGTNNGGIKLPTNRYTPYHVPHRTEIAGFMTILHGDNRFYNNIFVQGPVSRPLRILEKFTPGTNDWDDGNCTAGIWPFKGYPTFAEWDKQFEGYCGMGSPDSDRYYDHLPIWTGGNVYLNGARPWEKEENFAVDTQHAVRLEVVEKDGSWQLETDVYEFLPDVNAELITTDTLGMAFEPEQKFENADGTPIVFSVDYYGAARPEKILPGPLASGSSVIC